MQHALLHWINVIIIPLFSWLLILASIYFLATSRKVTSSTRYHLNLHHLFSRFWFPHHFASIVIILSIGMSVLEAARLGVSKQYYGALYFSPIGFLVALAMHSVFVLSPAAHDGIHVAQTNGKLGRGNGKWKPTVPTGVRLMLWVYWLAQVVVHSIKVGALASGSEGNHLYKKSDETLDIAVLLGLLVVLAVVEVIPGQGVIKRVDGGGAADGIVSKEEVRAESA